MVRTLKLDEEKDKTSDKINALQTKNYVMGLSRKDTFNLNFLQFKLHHLNLIEYSNDKYVPKQDEKRIKIAFMEKRY